jgi:predicted RNA binding protein YcfA (HicA-like mRNA interferase family)
MVKRNGELTMMSSKEIIKKLKADGWYQVGSQGDHRQFAHPVKPGKVTVPHPVKDMKLGTLRSIERQSGIKLR